MAVAVRETPCLGGFNGPPPHPAFDARRFRLRLGHIATGQDLTLDDVVSVALAAADLSGTRSAESPEDVAECEDPAEDRSADEQGEMAARE